MADRAEPSPEDIAGPALQPHSTSAPTMSSPTTAPAATSGPSTSPVRQEQSRAAPRIPVAGPSASRNLEASSPQAPPRSFSPVGVNESTPFTAGYPYQGGAGVPAGGYYSPQAAGSYYPPYAAYQPYTGALPSDVGTGAAGVAPGAGGGAALADNQPKTFMQRMAGSDEHWQWKLSLRVILIILDIVAIGAVAAIAAQSSNSSFSWFYYDGTGVMPYVLIPLIVSLIWCLIVVLVLLLRRPPRAVHPGIAVGIDLVLWLAFIFTLLFTVSDVIGVADWFNDIGELSGPYTYGNNYEGGYSLAPNGTWVWTQATNEYNNNYAILAQKTDMASPTTVATLSVSATSTSVDAAVTTPPPALSGAAKRALGISSASPYYPDSSYSDSPSSVSPYSYPPYSYSPYSSSDEYANPEPYTYNDPYAYGNRYTTDSNGFYVWITTTATGFAATATSSATRQCEPEFTSCAQQDAYVNRMWQQKPRRFALDLLAAIIQGIAVITHFTLFVWACVDTNRRNRLRRTNNMTMDVLQDMRQRGYVMVPAAAIPIGGDAQGQWQPTSPRAAEKAPAGAAPQVRFA
ncbi:hypothetical protein SEPCBS57363_004565 [Sporothrix epigloea]|uniref:MARVEL domain-containing protein n=1 Tax=Sporothrix epigloea TaxID=1892477 RepID=A0ABP0DVL8_9PEZI